jgi:MinD-like ATPase involved in chromosome partitioning or flagellar assembly
VDLPTYTSIWRIEKRLYKLYDFRLPMPLPIGQVTVFVAIAVPYVVLLQVLGLPFNHTLIWLYLLPPGLLTWLVTRPVLESKRLPELVRSQLRYLAEPRVLCRMAPLAESDVLVVSGRVWRPRASRRAAAAARAPIPATPPVMAAPPIVTASATAAPQVKAAPPTVTAPARAAPPVKAAPQVNAAPRVVTAPPAAARTAQPPATPPGAAVPARQQAPSPQRAAVTVVGAGRASAPPSVERALAGPSARRGNLGAGPVTVVPGGDRPGKPNLLLRDRVRAQLAVGRPARIVFLGCTVGAGQTTTALFTGEALASLRSGDVAVLDLNPGPASLAKRAQARPALSQAAMVAKSRLIVVQPAADAVVPEEASDRDPAAGRCDPVADAMTFAAAADAYELVLADPATASVPRLLAVADQLVLVAPASTAAPGAVAMTFEWLDANGHGVLSAGAVMVLNGVSRRSLAAVEQAERVCAGRCRAIVRVPWDDQLRSHGPGRNRPPASASQDGAAEGQHWAGLLTSATATAYTALAGVVVAALAEGAAERGPQRTPASAGGARR